MVYVKGFFTFLGALPQILALFDQIKIAVAAGVHSISITIDLKKFDQDANQAIQTGDTSGLEGIFNPKPDPIKPPSP